MKVVAFLEPPQGDVIEKTLRGHQSAAMVGGLWHASAPRAPPAGDGWVHGPDGNVDRQTTASDEFRELTFVAEATFEATFQFSPTPVGPWTVRAFARIRV